MPAPRLASPRFLRMRRSRSKASSRFRSGAFEVRAPGWLTARPIAHRGLHDISRGIVENMPAAFEAAISGHFAIETDLQLSADGEAMVHHDDALGRLTEGSGALLGKTAAELKAVTCVSPSERMITLGDLC